MNIPKLNLNKIGGNLPNSMTTRDNDLRNTQPPSFEHDMIEKPKSARGQVDRRTDPGTMNSGRKRISKLH